MQCQAERILIVGRRKACQLEDIGWYRRQVIGVTIDDRKRFIRDGGFGRCSDDHADQFSRTQPDADAAAHIVACRCGRQIVEFTKYRHGQCDAYDRH